MDMLTATFTLFLVMDPIGNVPAFLSYLKDVPEDRRVGIVGRESCIALVILLFFLLCGPPLTRLLHLTMPSLQITGGVLLFLIAVGMVFPGAGTLGRRPQKRSGVEPFIVPLATPLIAGPSTFATIMILTAQEPLRTMEWLCALVIAWGLSTLILLLSPRLSRLLGPRGLEACERLTGMILTVVAVQMFLDGVEAFLARHGR